MKTKKKLYVIGLDSAPLWVINDLRKRHAMKGFTSFVDEGILKELESTLPPVTAAAWPSIYSGRHPREHGIMDFIHIDKNYTRQLIYYEPEKHRPFWEILAEKGYKSLVITPAMVLQKSKSKNVDMITGWPLPPKYGSKAIENAAKKFGFKGEPDIGIDLDKQSIPLQKGSEMYSQSMRARAEMSKYLITKNNYDLAFICFTETDRIQHYALNNPKWETYLSPLYKEASDFIEWVVAYSKKKKEDSLIILVSDHGAQPVHNKFLTNSWLVKNGYATLKTNEKSASKEDSMQKVKRHASEVIMKLPYRRTIYSKMPAFLKKPVEKMLDESLQMGQDSEHIRIQESDFDMANTKAFSAVSNGPVGMMWINDSRFSNPAVKNSEVKKTFDEISDKLKKIKTSNGSPLVLKVIDGRKYYFGAKSFISPDLLFELSEGNIIDFAYYSPKSVFMKPEIYRSGDHTKNGIIGIIGGKPSRKDMSVYDVFPMIMDHFK